MPARRGQIKALAVTTTATAFDLSKLPMQQVVADATRSADWIYVMFQADGGDVFYQFAPDASVVNADPTQADTVGPLTTYNTAHCAKIPSGGFVDLQINRNLDRVLIVRTSTGTATLRFWPSSQT